MHQYRRSLVLVLALSFAPATVRAQADSLRVARLVGLGRLFGVVKYFHPAFLERNVEWDSATVAAIDAVRAAKSTDNFRSAIASLLGVLADPATRVVAPHSRGSALPGARKSTKRWEMEGADSTLVISLPDFATFQEVMQLLGEAQPDVKRAPSIVFDLRGVEPEELGNSSFMFEPIRALLATQTISAPAQRLRMHSGFVPQSGGTSGGYWSGTYEKAGTVFAGASTNRSRRVIFLATAGSDIPDIAFALRNAGQGAIVVEGSGGVTGAQLRAGAEVYKVALGEGVTAVVRLSDGAGSADADTVVARDGAGDPALRAALAFAKRPVAAAAEVAAPVARSAYVPPPENAYPAMRYPTPAYRVFAAYRYWNAIHYFYPYKHLIGEGWGNVLPRAIRMLDAARDSLEFGIALEQMVSYTHDSHSGVTGNLAVREYIGRLPTAVLLQHVEGQPVVIRIADDSLTRASGIAVGDIIVRVDGVDVAARRRKLTEVAAYSTLQSLDNEIAARLLRGSDSSVQLIVRGRDNRERRVTLPRRASFGQLIRYPRSGPVMKMLPGNVGYADLSFLTPSMVDSMFEMFRHTKGIIFDDRGYPQGTAWSIAPRLNAEPVPAARFQRPLVTSPDTIEQATVTFVQSTPRGSKWVYQGKTILLVDERTISQAEHTGLFLEAANRTRIVGSPTMGANGDVTRVALVGGMYATFSGHDVRHADGRQLQRVGLQPDVVVRPTIAGIRAGRDEVLERALQILTD